MARAGDGKVRSSKRKADAQVSKRLTKDQLDEFDIRAIENGFSDRQSYLSAFLLGQIEIDLSRKRDITIALGHIGKVGSNLNQIAHVVNSGLISTLSKEDVDAIRSAQESVEQIGAEIREALK